MNEITLIALPFISFAAFFLKAMTGFGPAIVVISIGSLLFPPQEMIATSSILDFIAGVLLFKNGGAKNRPKFLASLILAIVVGTLVGATLLQSIPSEQFKPILGFAILSLSVWFILFRTKSSQKNLSDTLPDKCDREDIGYSFLGGVCGGLFGISGPPIIWHLGRRYQKDAFRSILITIFIVAALTRILSYSATGLVTKDVFFYVLASLPGQLLGLHFGSKLFVTIDETRFSQIVGAILLAISVKLLI